MTVDFTEKYVKHVWIRYIKKDYELARSRIQQLKGQEIRKTKKKELKFIFSFSPELNCESKKFENFLHAFQNMNQPFVSYVEIRKKFRIVLICVLNNYEHFLVLVLFSKTEWT
jgi:hypothetical protein